MEGLEWRKFLRNLAKLRKEKPLQDMRRHKNSSSGLGNWEAHENPGLN